MKNLCLSILTFAFYAHIAAALPIYTATDLGDFPGGPDQSQASGINASGQVVGYGFNASRRRAFLAPANSDGTTGLMDLGELPRLPSTGARAINARGQIVGASVDGDKSRSFLWTPSAPNSLTGLMTEVENLPGERNSSSAAGINAMGQIAGTSVGHAYLWKPAVPNGTTGTATDLGGLPGGSGASLVLGLNDSGQVVGISNTVAGDHAFLWTPAVPNGTTGSMIDLGNLPGSTGLSQATAVSGSGNVIGNSAAASGGAHAFFWTPAGGGSMTDLGAFDGGNDLSYAYGINAANEVVGHSNSAEGDHAFRWTGASGTVDLNSLLDETGRFWTLRFATSVNDQGQIVGSGEFDPDGPGENTPVATHAFRLDRVGEVNPGQLYVRPEAQGQIAFYFASTRGVTYQLEGAPNLAGPWLTTDGPIGGNGGIVTVRKTPAGDRFFWRLSEVAAGKAYPAAGAIARR